MKLSRHAVVAVVVLAIVAMVLPLSAFARTKIEYFFPTMVEGPLAREMTKIVNEYNKMQDQVKVIAAYTGTYDETKIKAQAAFEAGKPPAVVLMSPFSIFDFVLSDYLEPLNPLIKADGMDPEEFFADFWEAAHPNAIFDGTIVAVPFQMSTPLLYVNCEHLAEVGLSCEKPPATWKELVAAAKKLTKKQGNKVIRWGIMMPSNYDYLGWLLEALTLTNGGRFFNTDYRGEVYYDTPTTKGALQLWYDFVYKHGVMPAGVTEGREVGAAFFAGKASMVMLSTGSLTAVRKNAKFKYNVAFIPRNVRHKAPLGGAFMVIMKGLSPEKKKAAWDFLKWLTNAENLARWSRFTGYFGPRKSSYDLPVMKEFTAAHPDAVVGLDQLRLYGYPILQVYNSIAVRKALEDEMHALLNNKTTVEKAAAEAQKKANQIMAPYNKDHASAP